MAMTYLKENPNGRLLVIPKHNSSTGVLSQCSFEYEIWNGEARLCFSPMLLGHALYRFSIKNAVQTSMTVPFEKHGLRTSMLSPSILENLIFSLPVKCMVIKYCHAYPMLRS